MNLFINEHLVQIAFKSLMKPDHFSELRGFQLKSQIQENKARKTHHASTIVTHPHKSWFTV